MILRSVIEHVRTQNWTAVGIDFVIVVVGVFIGIQVSNYNDTLGDRADERVYLNAMAEDIQFSIERLEELIVALEQQQEARKLLYRYSKGQESGLSAPELNGLVQAALYNLQRMNISQVAFNTLANSGRLSLIGEAELVRELQSLDSMVAEGLEVQADDFEITYRFTDPFLVAQADMQDIVVAERIGDGSVLDWVERQADHGIPPETLKTVAFRNLVLYRAEATRGRLVSVRELLAQHRVVADLLANRRSALGDAP